MGWPINWQKCQNGTKHALCVLCSCRLISKGKLCSNNHLLVRNSQSGETPRRSSYPCQRSLSTVHVGRGLFPNETGRSGAQERKWEREGTQWREAEAAEWPEAGGERSAKSMEKVQTEGKARWRVAKKLNQFKARIPRAEHSTSQECKL